MFKIRAFIWLMLWLGITCAEPNEAPTCHKDQVITSNSYDALLWYRTAAEKNALYHQIFNSGLSQISNSVTQNKLKANSWGIILALDGTLLDDSSYILGNSLRCLNDNPETKNAFYAESQIPATPGAAQFSCAVQKLGGKVIIVSNRDGSDQSGHNLRQATLANLSRQQICYDSVLFANELHDSNKNPRFTAVTSGDYENIIASSVLPALKIIAFFGSDIQDFPDFKQSMVPELGAESSVFAKFGSIYFMLPNPTTGSWQNNYLK